MRFLKDLIIIAIAILIVAGCGRAPIVKKTKFLMDTWVSIKVHDPHRNSKKIKSLIEKSFLGIENINSKMSRFLADSEVSKINELKYNQALKVSTDTLSLLNKAEEVYKITNGAFDITVSPLLELWGFYKEGKRSIPSIEDIKHAMQFIGQDKVIIDREFGYVTLLEEGVEIDLSGIAKGFAVDEAVNILKREGIRNALIEAGGDIYCLGSAPDGRPWRIGLKHPRGKRIITTLTLKNMAVATSGDYEKFFEIDGERFSHIIDPRSGYPVKNGVVSVTVLAGDCTTADALATAVTVLGTIQGLALVNSIGQAEAIVLTEENGPLEVYVSNGLKGLYEFES